MHVEKYEKTRESNLDRVKKFFPCPKGAKEHSATSYGGEGAQRAVGSAGGCGKDIGARASVSTDVWTSRTYRRACACKPRGRPGRTSVGTRTGARVQTDVRGEARSDARARVLECMAGECARGRARVLFTREHGLHLKSPK
ncbi:hypothetical protein CRG98_026223 [Punica granatum]|uniref:Uncharacterized protein n=1 Tax=Punica granatum TaxID=22663 RepID=A0A2I0JBI3_PUNGR|nr:hypothetical protein CRG98_026223 [Punica granatum]